MEMVYYKQHCQIDGNATRALILSTVTMRFSIALAGCGLLTYAFAFPTASSKRHVLHERRERLPTNWARDAELHSESLLPLRIALTQNNLDKADEYLMDVSNPTSPNYGKHWTAQEVAEAFAPSDITIKSVVRWLADAGITSDRITQSRGLNWLHADLKLHEAESLLRTKYYRYTHAETGHTHVACEEYSVPEDVQSYVDFITPTVHFDRRVATPKNRRDIESHGMQANKPSKSAIGHTVQPGIGHTIGSPEDPTLPKLGDALFPDDVFDELDNCDNLITPACLQALYELPDSDYFDPNPESKSPSRCLARDLAGYN